MSGDRIYSQRLNKVKKFNIFKRDILDCIYVSEFAHLMMGKCNIC